MSQESYIPSQTPESEEYSSCESSSLETPSESDYSIASSGQCSGSSDLPSSYFSVSDTESSILSDTESDSQSSDTETSDSQSSTFSE